VKPKLLLCPGTGYSATTPLYYTLAVNHRYCHGGFDKEYELLPTLYYKEANRLRDYLYHYKYRFKRHQNIQSFDNGIYKKHGFKRERHPEVDYNNSYTKLDPEYYYNRPVTLEKYIKYYKELYDDIKDVYQSGCDFTTANGNLPLWFLQKIAPELQEHFDIKVLIINRDPVRRLFSEVNVRYQKDSHGFLSATQMFFYILDNPTGRHFGLHRQYENFNVLSYHTDVVSNYSQVFSDVLEISMESFWDGEDLVSDFLGYKIDQLYNNCYHPFMGSNPPHYRYLEDQWMSDKEELTEEDYDRAKLYWHR
tara:strand:+ start:751 stop:1671 length:921 start_codon:yes stop_codon:yes gene_type:complete